jgi:hypothetical protein
LRIDLKQFHKQITGKPIDHLPPGHNREEIDLIKDQDPDLEDEEAIQDAIIERIDMI